MKKSFKKYWQSGLMAIAVLLIAPLAFASTLTVPQGGTGLTSVASGNILYGTGTNVLSSDSNATRVPGTLTNISDSFSSGDTSAFQLNPNFLGAGLAGVGLTQTAADGKAVVFSGDGTSTGQSDFANTIYSMDNSGSQGIIVADGKTGTGTVSAQYQDGPISAVLGLNDGGSTVTYGDGSLVSGIAALPGQVLRLINGTVWNWPTTDGSNGQVLTTDGSGNLSFQTAGGGGGTVYTATQVVFGDGSTPGGITDPDFTFTPGINPTFEVGDNVDAGNSNTFAINDSGGQISANVSNNFAVFGSLGSGIYVGSAWLNVFPGQNVQFGDISGVGNSTRLEVDDQNLNITIQAANGILAIDNGGNNYWTFDPNSGIFKYGLFNSGNYTNLAMNDSGESLTFHTGGNPSTGNVMTLTGGASTTDAAFGDLDHLGNDTIFDLNDSTQTITFGYGSSGSYTFPIGNATGVLTNDGSGNLSWAPAGGSSPFTIQNTNSIFSTGLTGLWTSNATDSFIEGDNASDNSSGSTLDSVTWIGDLAGASDGSQSFEAPRSDFIGNRAGYNAFNAQNSTFMGYLAGAYATDASYSVFMGAQAGEQATYAGNSFFFGQGAGDNATVAGDSIFMGLLSGENATNAGTSNFFGANSGNGATNANNSTFIGSYSGFNDTVNNQGLITYTGESAPFDPGQPITSTSGGAAVVISDDTSGNLVIINSKGTFTPGDTITETNGGQTATLVTYTPSTSSILIGDNTTTGGGKNSVAIGANASNAGFNNSICIGVSCLNTDNDQYAWGDQITKWRFAGTSFSLPTVAPSGNGQFLAVGAGNQLSWAVPGASDGGLTVLAATLTTLPDSPTYSNGSSGVGATLSATSNGSLTVDGVAIPLNGRILVDDESNQTWNGVYRQSTLGDGSTAYVLTRTTDADTTTEFTDMVVSPSEGTQSSTAFGQQTATPTIGTDDIVFDSLSSIYLRQETSGTQAADQIPIYTGTGLTLTKGTSDFTYTPYSGGGGALDIDNTNQNDFIGGGIASATGFENAGFGNETLASLTSGSANTALGVNAGDTITSGQENTLIGTGSETATATTSGGIALGFDSVAASNEFSLAPAITNWKFQGDSYTLPTAFPTSSGNGIFESTTSGVMSWGNGQLPITIFTPTTGTTVNLVDNNYNAVNPSGAILALTVNFPSSPANGDVVEIKYDQGVTTITYSGGTVLGGTTTAALGAYAKFTFNGSTWY